MTTHITTLGIKEEEKGILKSKSSNAFAFFHEFVKPSLNGDHGCILAKRQILTFVKFEAVKEKKYDPAGLGGLGERYLEQF